MRILGISAFYHDSAACLVVDGKIIAAAQEERFSRIKHDKDFPRESLAYCLEEGKCNIEQIDHIVFFEKPSLKISRLFFTYLSFTPKGFLFFIPLFFLGLKASSSKVFFL